VDRSSLEEIIKRDKIPVHCFDQEAGGLEVVARKVCALAKVQSRAIGSKDYKDA
jgi:hypothetical protein